MKLNLILALLLFGCINVHSQVVQIENVGRFENENQEHIDKILGPASDGYYIIKSMYSGGLTPKTVINIHKYSKDNKFIWKKALPISYTGYNKAMLINNKVHVFHNKVSLKSNIPLVSIFSEKGEIEEKTLEDDAYGTHYSFTQDSSKVLIVRRDEKSGGYGSKVLAVNAKTLKIEKTYQIPASFENTPCLSYQFKMQANGDLFFILSSFNKKQDLYRHYIATSNGSEIKTLMISAGEKVIANYLNENYKDYFLANNIVDEAGPISFTFLKNNNLVITAVYQDKENLYSTGIINVLAGSDMKMISMKTIDADPVVEKRLRSIYSKSEIKDLSALVQSIQPTSNGFITFTSFFTKYAIQVSSAKYVDNYKLSDLLVHSVTNSLTLDNFRYIPHNEAISMFLPGFHIINSGDSYSVLIGYRSTKSLKLDDQDTYKKVFAANPKIKTFLYTGNGKETDVRPVSTDIFVLRNMRSAFYLNNKPFIYMDNHQPETGYNMVYKTAVLNLSK